MEAATAIEIGTHWGGSAVALMRGMLARHSAPLLVTIDVSTESDNYLPAQPEYRFIKKVLGDANDLKTVEQVRAQVQKVDLLFIDARHWAEFTLLNTFLYGMLFRPRAILVDDITLNDSMRAAWAVLRAIYSRQSVDCKTIVPDIRRQEGFGLILLDGLNR
jgi:cephalosporin hydroxylase